MRGATLRFAVFFIGLGMAAAAIGFGLFNRVESTVSYRHAEPEGRFYVSITGMSGPGSGPTRTVSLDGALYDAAATGDQANVRLWHGEIVGLEVGGIGSDPGPRVSLISIGRTMLAWEGIGLALWAVLGFGPRHSPHIRHEAPAWFRIVLWTAQGAMLGAVLAFGGLVPEAWTPVAMRLWLG
jgi:hypothetical protein